VQFARTVEAFNFLKEQCQAAI